MGRKLTRVKATEFTWPVGWTLQTAEGRTNGKGTYDQMLLQFRKGSKRYWIGVAGTMKMLVWK